MEKLYSFKTSLIMLVVTLCLIAFKSLHAEKLCEIKALKNLDNDYNETNQEPAHVVGKVLSSYRLPDGKDCSLSLYGGPFGDKNLVEHVENAEKLQEELSKENLEKTKILAKMQKLAQQKEILKAIDEDKDYTNAEIKALLRGILKYLKAKEIED